MNRTTIIGLIALVAATVAEAAPGIASAAGWQHWHKTATVLGTRPIDATG